jgi:hypothetical protein
MAAVQQSSCLLHPLNAICKGADWLSTKVNPNPNPNSQLLRSLSDQKNSETDNGKKELG